MTERTSRKAAPLSSFRAPPGLYLHVPFCSRFCPFCPYNKTVYEKERVERYFRAVSEEASALLAEATTPLGSLYIGGGTPTLCLSELEALLPTLPI